jgi:hypothetical protein
MAAYTFEDGALIISEYVIDIELKRTKGRVTREEAFDLARVANEIRKERELYRSMVMKMLPATDMDIFNEQEYECAKRLSQ